MPKNELKKQLLLTAACLLKLWEAIEEDNVSVDAFIKSKENLEKLTIDLNNYTEHPSWSGERTKYNALKS